MGEFAWVKAEYLRQRGEEPEGIELLDLVLERFDELSYRPMLLAMRGELKRADGRFDAALADLDAAEQAAGPGGSPWADFALHYVHGFRAQVWLDLGLLLLADAELREEGQVTVRLAAATRAGGSPEDLARAATFELVSAYRACALDIAMGANQAAADRYAALLSNEIFEAIPEHEYGTEQRRGLCLLMVARDELHASKDPHPSTGTLSSTALSRCRSALEASLRGNLVAEEEIEARLDLVDAGWLAEDRDLEQRELTALNELLAQSPEGFPAERQARLAAFVARNLLERGDAPRDALLDALCDIETSFARVESEWMAKQRAPEGLGFLHFPEQRLVVETWARLLITVLGPEDGPHEALAVLARAQAIGTLTRRLGSSTVDSRELLETHLAALPEGAGVLVWLPGLDSSLVLAADRDQVLFAGLPAGSILEKHATKLASLVRSYPTQPRETAVAERAAALAEVLLPAEIAERVSGWNRALLVGTELFGSPGLEPLPLGEGTLGERLATSYSPSIPLAELLRRRAPASWGGARASFLAATGLGPKPVELREDELARVREVISPGELGGRFEIGSRARRDALGAYQSDLLAILGHGRYDPLQARPASIELADGALGCAELEAIELPPLVCLLACGAARGPQVLGDAGTVHLGGAALVGGAEAVLLTDTEIEVAATLALFEAFLGALREGAPPDEALRRARLAVAKQDPGWSDPFYSSGLRLFGWGGPSTTALEPGR